MLEKENTPMVRMAGEGGATPFKRTAQAETVEKKKREYGKASASVFRIQTHSHI